MSHFYLGRLFPVIFQDGDLRVTVNMIVGFMQLWLAEAICQGGMMFRLHRLVTKEQYLVIQQSLSQAGYGVFIQRTTEVDPLDKATYGARIWSDLEHGV